MFWFLWWPCSCEIAIFVLTSWHWTNPLHVVSIYTELDFFFFLNQCILFVMNVRVLVVDHCHWILSAAAAAVAVRSAGGGVERCSYPTVCLFFYYSYLINLLRLLLERVERLLFSIYCCTYCNITVLLWRSTAHLKALNFEKCDVWFLQPLFFTQKKKINLVSLEVLLFYFICFHKISFHSKWLRVLCPQPTMQGTLYAIYSLHTLL